MRSMPPMCRCWKNGRRKIHAGPICLRRRRALCHALAVKSELGLKLKKAYDAGDRAALASLADHDIPEAVQRWRRWRRRCAASG